MDACAHVNVHEHVHVHARVHVPYPHGNGDGNAHVYVHGYEGVCVHDFLSWFFSSFLRFSLVKKFYSSFDIILFPYRVKDTICNIFLNIVNKKKIEFIFIRH